MTPRAGLAAGPARLMSLNSHLSPPMNENDALRSLSDVIEGLGDGDTPHLSFQEIVDALGERGFGALILFLSLLALLPWPPGGKAVFSAPIMLLSLEMAVQRDAVWLPKWVLKASIPRSAYRNFTSAPFAAPAWLRRWVLTRKFRIGLPGLSSHTYIFSNWVRHAVRRRPRGQSVIRLLRSVERLTRPRLAVLTGDFADGVIGVLCFLLAVMMALPIPIGDMLPGVTLIIFGLALSQRDGLAVLIGGVGTAACFGYLFLIWRTVLEIFQAIASWIGLIG